MSSLKYVQDIGFAWGRQEATYGELFDWFQENGVGLEIAEKDGVWSVRAWFLQGDKHTVFLKGGMKEESEALWELVKHGTYVYRIIKYDDYHFIYD